MPDFSDVLLDPGLAAHFPISSFHLQIAAVVLKALALRVLAALEKHILRGLLITGFVTLHLGEGWRGLTGFWGLVQRLGSLG